MKRSLALAVLGATTALAPAARAVEREHQVGAGVGPTFFVANGKTSFGGGFDAHYTYGLTDAFNLLVEVSWATVAFHGGTDPSHTRPSWVAGGEVGASYVFDVLRWVPYVGVLVGGGPVSGGPLGRTKMLPDVVLALGLDYRIDRSWAVGAAVREHMFYTEMSTYPSNTQIFARAEYTWGW